MNGSYLLIEASGFTTAITDYFGSDENYSEFQSDLASNPDKGNVIPGVAPLRKIRWSDKRRGMGKRGGLRVIYIHIPDLKVLFLLDLYGKDESEDLTKDEKKELKQLATQLVNALRQRKQEGRL